MLEDWIPVEAVVDDVERVRVGQAEDNIRLFEQFVEAVTECQDVVRLHDGGLAVPSLVIVKLVEPGDELVDIRVVVAEQHQDGEVCAVLGSRTIISCFSRSLPICTSPQTRMCSPTAMFITLATVPGLGWYTLPEGRKTTRLTSRRGRFRPAIHSRAASELSKKVWVLVNCSPGLRPQSKGVLVLDDKFTASKMARLTIESVRRGLHGSSPNAGGELRLDAEVQTGTIYVLFSCLGGYPSVCGGVQPAIVVIGRQDLASRKCHV